MHMMITFRQYPFWRKGVKNAVVFTVVVLLAQIFLWLSYFRLWGRACVITTATVSIISFVVVFILESFRPEARKKQGE